MNIITELIWTFCIVLVAVKAWQIHSLLVKETEVEEKAKDQN